MIVAVKKNNNIVVGISTTDTYSGQTERDMLLQENVPFGRLVARMIVLFLQTPQVTRLMC